MQEGEIRELISYGADKRGAGLRHHRETEVKLKETELCSDVKVCCFYLHESCVLLCCEDNILVISNKHLYNVSFTFRLQ